MARPRLRATTPSAAIPPVVFGNPRRPELPLEVLAFSELRRKAPSGYLARPQRPEFHSLVVPTRGRCTHEVDFEQLRLGPGALAWVRPGQVQRFDLHAGVEGLLVLFTADFLHEDLALVGPRIELGDVAEDVTWLIERLRRISEEPGDPGTTRRLMQHLLHALLSFVERGARPGDAPPLAATSAAFASFRAEVERRFTDTREVQAYARFTGYSAKTLTRATLAATGLGAKAYVDRRVLLEARRLLAHSELTSAQIAHRLGFSEATNFIKFFQREGSESPSVFRERSRRR